MSLQALPERGRFVPEFADGTTREILYGFYRIVYRINVEQEDGMDFPILACGKRPATA